MLKISGWSLPESHMKISIEEQDAFEKCGSMLNTYMFVIYFNWEMGYNLPRRMHPTLVSLIPNFGSSLVDVCHTILVPSSYCGHITDSVHSACLHDCFSVCQSLLPVLSLIGVSLSELDTKKVY